MLRCARLSSTLLRGGPASGRRARRRAGGDGRRNCGRRDSGEPGRDRSSVPPRRATPGARAPRAMGSRLRSRSDLSHKRPAVNQPPTQRVYSRTFSSNFETIWHLSQSAQYCREKMAFLAGINREPTPPVAPGVDHAAHDGVEVGDTAVSNAYRNANPCRHFRRPACRFHLIANGEGAVGKVLANLDQSWHTHGRELDRHGPETMLAMRRPACCDMVSRRRI